MEICPGSRTTSVRVQGGRLATWLHQPLLLKPTMLAIVQPMTIKPTNLTIVGLPAGPMEHSTILVAVQQGRFTRTIAQVMTTLLSMAGRRMEAVTTCQL